MGAFVQCARTVSKRIEFASPQVIAVGGVGASIDIFINASHRAFSLVMR
jgi:hypothetical protein